MCVCKTRPRLGHVVLSAARDPVNLSVGGLAVFAAPFLGSFGLLALGIALYVALVAWRTASPAFWRQVLDADVAEKHRLPDTLNLSDPLLRTTVTEIRAARGSVTQALKDTPEALRPQLQFAEEALDELECMGARLLRRAERISQYLTTVRRESIVDEIRRLGDLNRRSQDDEAKREYDRAREAREEQLRAVDEVMRAQERLLAKLQRVIAHLEGLAPSIVRLRVLDSRAREDFSAELDEELDRMSGELRASEQQLGALESASTEALLEARPA